MNRMTSRMSVAAKIIGAMSVVVTLFLIAIGIVIQTSTTGLHQALIDDTQAQFTEMARQIAMTLDASIDPAALTSAPKMQAIIDRNIAARQTHRWKVSCHRRDSNIHGQGLCPGRSANSDDDAVIHDHGHDGRGHE